MHLNLHLPAVPLSRGERWFLAIAWMVIVAKCVFVNWAFQHWSVPLNANWVILPTLTFAAVATALWVSHRE